jgi:hypothetical protein
MIRMVPSPLDSILNLLKRLGMQMLVTMRL